AWTPPSLVEASLTKQHSNAASIWLGLFVLLAVVMVFKSLTRKPVDGSRRITVGSVFSVIALISVIALNIGFYSQPRDKDLRKPPTIYLWCGLDFTSQSQSFGIFYKGWFYDFREDIQGKFSDIARVCRENAEK